jgi:hypothetical protein
VNVRFLVAAQAAQRDRAQHVGADVGLIADSILPLTSTMVAWSLVLNASLSVPSNAPAASRPGAAFAYSRPLRMRVKSVRATSISASDASAAVRSL